MSLRVLACGGRLYEPEDRVFETLDVIHRTVPIELLIHFDTNKVDHCARDWARKHHIRHTCRRQIWGLNLHPDVVVAFPGGRHTEEIIRRARKMHITVIEPEKICT